MNCETVAVAEIRTGPVLGISVNVVAVGIAELS
jgi:hypothetical protein